MSDTPRAYDPLGSLGDSLSIVTTREEIKKKHIFNGAASISSKQTIPNSAMLVILSNASKLVVLTVLSTFRALYAPSNNLQGGFGSGHLISKEWLPQAEFFH
jgi:hypothetical protein